MRDEGRVASEGGDLHPLDTRPSTLCLTVVWKPSPAPIAICCSACRHSHLGVKRGARVRPYARYSTSRSARSYAGAHADRRHRVRHRQYLTADGALGRGASRRARLSIGGAYEMWQQGEPVTAMIVLFCAVIAPEATSCSCCGPARGAAAARAASGRRDAALGGLHAALVDERGDDARHPGRADQDRRAGNGGARHRHVSRWAL